MDAHPGHGHPSVREADPGRVGRHPGAVPPAVHSSELEALQAEIDQLRLYVATTLFQILIAREVFTADEAGQLMAALDADGEAGGGYHGLDLMTGAELPPEEDPFRNLGGDGGAA